MIFHKILLPLTFGPQPGKQQKLGVYKLHNFLGLIDEVTVFFQETLLAPTSEPQRAARYEFPNR